MVTDRPHIVLVLVDDQGYGDMGCHGHPALSTPHMDRLESESVRFEDFHVSPMCTPTRGSLLTGLDPLRHEAINVSSGRALLDARLTTLPDVLRADGYRTALFGKWHLGDGHPHRPQDRGFDRALWFPSSHITSAADHWENDYFNTWLRSEDGTEAQHPGYCTDVLFDEAFAWLREGSDATEPTFTYLSLNAMHWPFLVSDRYREPYLDEYDHELASYFGMVANVDENLGRLDATLRELGIWENTVVVYLSDNGGSVHTTGVYNAGMRGSKTELWDGGHRVPAFLRWPAATAGGEGRGRAMRELVVAQDVMPTLLSFAGVPTANLEFDGVDLSTSVIDGAPTLAKRTSVVQYSRFSRARPVYGDAVVMRGSWRYLVGDASLYDVAIDPGQSDDIARRHPGVVASLQHHYDDWWAAVSLHRERVQRISIGHPAEPVTRLRTPDWDDVFLDVQADIRDGIDRKGTWNVDIAVSGRYEIALRRWPPEAKLPLRAAAPTFDGADSTWPAGRALDIREARVRVGGWTAASDAVGDCTDAVVFEMQLYAGATTVEAVFLGPDEAELCGAYFVDVTPIPETA